jgi:hypothetical protein
LLLQVEAEKISTANYFSLAHIISIILTLFSNIVVWVFVLWSLSFIPFVALTSYKLSQDSKINLPTRPLKWLQLLAATGLPMVIFAIAWNISSTHSNYTIIQIYTTNEIIISLGGTVLIGFSLFFINQFIPPKAVAVRLSLLSMLIYTSLFLAYGQGYNAISFGVLFGILFYVMFASSQIEELGRNIVVYDLDSRISHKIDAINERFQKLKAINNEISLSKQESQLVRENTEAKRKLEETEKKQRLAENLEVIQSRKLELINKFNRMQVEILEKKIDILNNYFEVASKECATKLSQDYSEALDEFESMSKSLTTRELIEHMNSIIEDINLTLQDIPESMEQLKVHLLKATGDLESQTRESILYYDELENNK